MTTRTTRIFGSGIKRREDPRLIQGRAQYVDDVKIPGMVHARVIRPPVAGATPVRVDEASIKDMPGIVRVIV